MPNLSNLKLPHFPTSSLLIVLGSVVLGCGLFAVFIMYTVSALKPTPIAPLYPPPVVLDPEALTAKSAVLYDPKSGRVLFSKNSNTSLPLASLTKLMTVQAALATRPPGTLITITPQDLKPEGDWGLAPGDVISLSSLIKYALVASSNDAAAAVASSLGNSYLDDMNRTAGSLGLSHTYFLNSTGLDLNADTSGAYGSATDVALLASAFLREYPQYFQSTTKPKVSIQDGTRILSAAATALPLQDIPGFLGAKTGYTDLAGGNLVAAFDLEIGHPVIAVVLGSTQDGRFSDVRTLIEAARGN